ncbi:MAG: CRISPR-associated helicase Cas3' [Anaerolineae bacterium]|nr:CRISPR-associated helicase Cas3' [Anaerolineae bacterium]
MTETPDLNRTGLRPFQRRVTELILSGQSVILQAPTGAGKTRAALWPFFEATFFDQPFPRKAIYSVPMRVLANQFEKEYGDRIKRKGQQDKLPFKLQTGEHPDDPKLEASLIFATIDQTLSSFLHIPYSLSNRQANLNAGAIASSYLIFDEVHLFPPDNMLPTTLAMLRMLTYEDGGQRKSLVPFILMTATLSREMLEKISDYLGAVIVPDPEHVDEDGRNEMEAIQDLPNLMGKERIFRAHDRPLTAEEVIDRKGHLTLCICNTVQRAQTLYQDLIEQLGKDSVTLLHSRFFKEERKRKEEDIQNIFKPDWRTHGKPHILVATQVVEVGLDITSDVLLTEMAPASTLIQRAGRCARYENEKGDVHIYRPKLEDGQTPDYAPYFIHRQTEYDSELPRALTLCENTWDNLQDFDGKDMTWAAEQDFVNRSHREVDEAIMVEVLSDQSIHMGTMLKAMSEQDRGLAPKLIRSSHDSRFTIIFSEPNKDKDLRRNPFFYEGMSISPGMLYHHWKEAEEQIGDDHDFGPFAWRAVGLESDADYEYGQNDRYKWEEICDPGGAYQGGVALALNPSFVDYNADLGLHFPDAVRDAVVPKLKKRDGRHRVSYTNQLETYREHIEGLMAAYEKGMWLSERNIMAKSLQEELAYVVSRLEGYCAIPAAVFEQVMRVVIATHDLGKLDATWQQWAHNWQEKVGPSISPEYLAAHTNYDPDNKKQKALQRNIRPQRPNHAGESAWAVANLMWKVSQSEALSRAALTAIMRHHSPGVEGCGTYLVSEAALAEAQAVMQSAADVPEISLRSCNQDEQKMRKHYLARFGNQSYQEVVLYGLIVRALRLADQRSQQHKGKAYG